MPAKEGDKVKVEYTGTLDDGTVFDSTQHGDHNHPIEFTIGANEVIPGFENGIIGMEKGEEKKFDVQPSEAYGEYRQEFVKTVPRGQLPDEPEPKIGMVLGLNLPDGKQIPIKIVDISEGNVTLDMNHPLAGKVLHFDVKLLEIVS